MTTRNAAVAGRPTAEWENEGGALAPGTGRDAAGPRAAWRRLMTLAAMLAVWRDLSVSARRRIARDAAAAMRPAGSRLGRTAPPPRLTAPPPDRAEPG